MTPGMLFSSSTATTGREDLWKSARIATLALDQAWAAVASAAASEAASVAVVGSVAGADLAVASGVVSVVVMGEAAAAMEEVTSNRWPLLLQTRSPISLPQAVTSLR